MPPIEEKLTDTLPCPSVEMINRALGETGSEVHILMDLLEAADALGAKAAHFVRQSRL